MGVSFNIKLFDGDWWYQGCAAKLLLYFVDIVRKSGKNEVKISRRKLSVLIREKEHSVRDAMNTLINTGILRPDSAQIKTVGTYYLSNDYVVFEKEFRPDSAQIKSEKKLSSPRFRPDSAQIDINVTGCTSNSCDVYSSELSPRFRPDSAQIIEKEKRKKNSPIPPIKKIKKKESVLTDSQQLLPNGKVVLNKRARDTFEKIYQNLYGTAYYWSAKDAGQMTKLLNAIRFSRENRCSPLPTDTESMISSLEQFLESINKTWINDNYSVSMISSHYNEIISELRNKKINGKQENGIDSSTLVRKTAILTNVASYDKEWKSKNGDGSPDGQNNATVDGI